MALLEPFEGCFQRASGEVIGAIRHFDSEDRDLLRIELLSEEAVKTSEIEGEMLDRLSVQSSLRRQLGLDADARPVKPQERGVAEMMVDVYRTWSAPLEDKTLFRWHSMLMSGNRHTGTIGGYRTHDDAMQIVSGRHDKPTIHYEAPPSRQVPAEMTAYLDWFNRSAPDGQTPTPALTRAGIGHLYFESIHPFEDGNGRLGRALAEKSLAQNLGQPSLIALAYTLERGRKTYYDQLELNQRKLDITDWLIYFAETILKAQQTTLERVAFYIAKARFYDRFRDQFMSVLEKWWPIVMTWRCTSTNDISGPYVSTGLLSVTYSARKLAEGEPLHLVMLGSYDPLH